MVLSANGSLACCPFGLTVSLERVRYQEPSGHNKLPEVQCCSFKRIGVNILGNVRSVVVGISDGGLLLRRRLKGSCAGRYDKFKTNGLLCCGRYYSRTRRLRENRSNLHIHSHVIWCHRRESDAYDHDIDRLYKATLMMTTLRLLRIIRDDKGVAAVEFALVASVFLAMLFGAISSSIMGYSITSLHSAVEAAARCRSLGTTCKDKASTEAFAATKFHNVSGQAPTFALVQVDPQPCGHQVTGKLDYNFNWIIGSTTIPVTAAACFA